MPKRPYPPIPTSPRRDLLHILENPMQTQKEIAKATGYSASQVSRILCSPDFQAHYDIRMQDAALVARSKWLNRVGTSS
jgi:hypothetical protein